MRPSPTAVRVLIAAAATALLAAQEPPPPEGALAASRSVTASIGCSEYASMTRTWRPAFFSSSYAFSAS